MGEYTKTSENISRTLDSNPKASKQGSISEILQAYKNGTLQRMSVDEEELLQAKARDKSSERETLQRYTEYAHRDRSGYNALIQGVFGTPQRKGIEDEELLQGKFDSSSATSESTVQREVKPNNTGLPDNLKSGIENLSGYSMDDVKVHYNSDKPAQLSALAYAQGTDIHVAPGQEKHLPHEAWHVVQQKQGRVQSTIQMQGVNVNDNEGLEREADVMGEQVVEIKTNAQENMKEKSTLQNSDLRNNTIQRVHSVILNPQSSQNCEIGLLVFSSDPKMKNEELEERGRIKSDNPAFAGIISAGHTMLYGCDAKLAGEMFSYGFWTDNMDKMIAELFSQQMKADSDEVELVQEKGVMGEYRNDTHLALIMDDFETKVVIKVSKEVYQQWMEFVVSDKEIGGEFYTFSPGSPSKAIGSSTPEYLNNCVSYALYQTSQFIKYCTIERPEDAVALTSLQKFINSYNVKFEQRAHAKKDAGDERAAKTGLQGVLMGHISEYEKMIKAKIAETDSPYNNKNQYQESIRKEELLYLGERDYRQGSPNPPPFIANIKEDSAYNNEIKKRYMEIYNQGREKGKERETAILNEIQEIHKDKATSKEDHRLRIIELLQAYHEFR